LIGPSSWRLPKIEGSILKYRIPPLWPTSAHLQENKGRTLHSMTRDVSLVAWKFYSHYFWPGLIALPKNTQPYLLINFATSENWKWQKKKKIDD
jgi:hypothetical protein